jgi:transposase
MVSEANLKKLRLGGGEYIVCMPMRRGDEVTRYVLTQPGRYRHVAENLRVKQVVVGDGARRRRYVVCHNPEEERRQRAHRAKVLEELDAELKSLRELSGGKHSKRVCQLRASGRYGRYVMLDEKGKAKIDRKKVSAEERFDGKFVVHSNDDTLTAEDMALGYKQLLRVEQAWRTLKSGLKLRPVFHWAPHRIHAHVALTVLSLLLERVIERECEDTWRNIRDDLRQVKLAQLSSPDGEVWQVTEPSQKAGSRLKTRKIPPPGPIARVV